MRRCLAVLATATAATFVGTPAAFACGGLVAPNGAVRLVNTTTLVAYHDGVEHYVTSFEYEGGGTKFGSIIPLPGVPTSVTRGGSWTLQRLELEVHPPAPEAVNGPAPEAAAGPARVLLRTRVDALTITVVKGGGPAVTAWVRQQGFKVSPDLPTMLNFYAVRSPIFLTATFDPSAEAARGLHLGDGTPVDIAIPLSNPWVPLHILSLAKDPDDIVQADVFMLSDRQPALLSGPGVQLRVSRPAEPSLLNDLRSDRGMGWIPASAWLSYVTVDARASSLTYDLAADVSGNGHPSFTAAALVPAVTLRAPASGQSGWWPVAVLAGIGFLLLLLAAIGYLGSRRRA
jgi:Uncharacterized protein conserved in bacteria (DUF2330)